MKQRTFKSNLVISLAATTITVLSALAPLSASGETVLSGVSAFPVGHPFSQNFERFVEDVKQRSGGSLIIDYKGGAPAVGSPFNLVQRMQTGAFDIMNITGAYYDSVVPEGLAMALTNVPIQEQRQNGAYALLNEAHEERGLYYLGKSMEYVPFQLYLAEPIDTADLNGLRLRIAPHHLPFFTELGAATIRADLSDIYTYMANGTIDGFGWPLLGFLPDWYRATNYIVEPGFYDADIHLLLNLEAWNELSDEHKQILTDLMIEYEANNKALYSELNNAARAAHAENGLETITLPEGEARAWLETADEAGWAAVIERSPERGPKLRPLMTRADQ